MKNKTKYITLLVIVMNVFSGSHCKADYLDITALASLANYWLYDDCMGYDWCDYTDYDHDSRIDLIDFAIMAKWAGEKDIDHSPVGWWKFDEGSGNVAYDSSGNGNHGDLNGDPVWSKGRFGGALQFDGNGDFVNCGHSSVFNIPGSVTITAWVNMNSAEEWRCIIGKGYPGWLIQEWGSIYGYPDFVADSDFVHGTVNISDGNWHHIAGVYNFPESRLYIYVDGLLDNYILRSGFFPMNSEDLTIGEYLPNSRQLNGLIDEVRIYDTALSSDDIAYLACSVPVSFPIAVVPGTKLLPIGEDVPDYDENLRQVISLSGDWAFTPDGGKKYMVRVPGVWQNQGPGTSYHDSGLYVKTFESPEISSGQRIWLHFENVMTEAQIFLNGDLMRSHIGGWTPFEIDVTDYCLQNLNILEIEVDEVKDYFTHGFLRSISLCFGGIWGDVWLEVRPQAFIEDAFVIPDVNLSNVELHVQILNVADLPSGSTITARAITANDTIAGIATINATELDVNGVGTIDVSISDPNLWSPDNPYLYNMEVCILDSDEMTVVDRDHLTFGMREVRIEGDKFILNNKAIYFASILHWGYYPQYISPSCTKEEFRSEIRRLKNAGFNAINVCLLMFPERFYDVADEEGMMLWQVYPYWAYGDMRRPVTLEEKEDFKNEYREMFKKDRHHASVVLRSITCEGIASDQPLLQEVVDIAHQMIPNSLVQDNTTVMAQVYSDFYDHHPYYGINLWDSAMESWVDALDEKAGLSPFFFGEGIDFDTFRNIPSIISHYGNNRPWWAIQEYMQGVQIPGNFGTGEFWVHEDFTDSLITELGQADFEKIIQNSIKHSLLCRKYEIETSRLYSCFAGGAFTGIRDNILTRCGFYDDIGNLKYPIGDAIRLNAQTLPLIKTDRKSRCYRSGENATITSYISHYGTDDITGGTLEYRLNDVTVKTFEGLNVTNGEVINVGTWEFTVPETNVPTEVNLTAILSYNGKVVSNSWPIWFFPILDDSTGFQPVLYDPDHLLRDVNLSGIKADEQIIITSIFDSYISNHLNNGGKAILVDRHGSAFPSHDAPFWREVAVERYSPEYFGDFPWDGTIDLQFMDITPIKAYDVQPDQVPLLRTVNCRTMQQNNLIVKRNYGNGMLIATTLYFEDIDTENITGRNLLRSMLQELVSE